MYISWFHPFRPLYSPKIIIITIMTHHRSQCHPEIRPDRAGLTQQQAILPIPAISNRSHRTHSNSEGGQGLFNHGHRREQISLYFMAKKMLSTLRGIGHHGIAAAALAVSLYTIPIIFAARIASKSLSSLANLLAQIVLPFVDRIVVHGESQAGLRLGVQTALRRSLGALVGPAMGLNQRNVYYPDDGNVKDRLSAGNRGSLTNPEEDTGLYETQDFGGSSEARDTLEVNKEVESIRLISDMFASPHSIDVPDSLEKSSDSVSKRSLSIAVEEETDIPGDVGSAFSRPISPTLSSNFIPLLECKEGFEPTPRSSPNPRPGEANNSASSPPPELLNTNKCLPPEDQVPLPQVQTSPGLWQKLSSNQTSPKNEPSASDTLRERTHSEGQLPLLSLDQSPGQDDEQETATSHEAMNDNKSNDSPKSMEAESPLTSVPQKSKPLEYWFSDLAPGIRRCQHEIARGSLPASDPTQTVQPTTDEPDGCDICDRRQPSVSKKLGDRRISSIAQLFGTRSLRQGSRQQGTRSSHSLETIRRRGSDSDAEGSMTPRKRNVLRKSRRSTTLQDL